MAAGALQTVPLTGELTASLINRVAARFGMSAGNVLGLWTCRNSPARYDDGGVRADAEVVLNESGRRVLAELCGVESEVLARALPAFTVDGPKIGEGGEAGVVQARWRAAGALVGPAAHTQPEVTTWAGSRGSLHASDSARVRRRQHRAGRPRRRTPPVSPTNKLVRRLG